MAIHHDNCHYSYTIARTLSLNPNGNGDPHEADFGVGTYVSDIRARSQPGPRPAGVAFAYGPNQTLACQDLPPSIPPDQGSNHIATFFEKHPLMLQIVPQQLFMEHRRLYLTEGILKYGFSWSLEYAILAVVADLIDPEISEELAAKAKVILEVEISKQLTSYASTQASLLLGWRECGSPTAGHHSSTAAGLIRRFQAYYDPCHLVNTPMMPVQMEARRHIYWSFFVFDR